MIITRILYRIRHKVFTYKQNKAIVKKLKLLVPKNTDIYIVCVGYPNVMYDRIAPMIGDRLKSNTANNVYVLGTTEYPVHKININDVSSTVEKIIKENKGFIVAIDSMNSAKFNLGDILIDTDKLRPAGTNPDFCRSFGDVSIKIVTSKEGILLGKKYLSEKLTETISTFLAKYISIAFIE